MYVYINAVPLGALFYLSFLKMYFSYFNNSKNHCPRKLLYFTTFYMFDQIKAQWHTFFSVKVNYFQM